MVLGKRPLTGLSEEKAEVRASVALEVREFVPEEERGAGRSSERRLGEEVVVVVGGGVKVDRSPDELEGRELRCFAVAWVQVVQLCAVMDIGLPQSQMA